MLEPVQGGDQPALLARLCFFWLHIGVAVVGFGTLVMSVSAVISPAAAAAGLLTAAASLALLVVLVRTKNFKLSGDLATAFWTIGLGAAALSTGGLWSPWLSWMVVVMLLAGLQGGMRATIAAALAVSAVVALTAVYQAGAGFAASPRLELPAPMVIVSIWFGALLASGILLFNMALMRRASQLEIQSRDIRYRLIAEHCSDLITCHTTGGECQYASPSSERLLGVSSGSLLGRGFLDRVHVSDRPAVMQAFSSAMFTGQQPAIRFRLKTEAGPGAGQNSIFSVKGFVWFELRCSPSDRGVGQSEVVCVSRDITSTVANETAIAEARAAAEQTSEAKSKFLASVSHEFRTPLNAIIGFSEILGTEEAELFGKQRQQEYAQLINQSGHHLLQLVNDILDLSKLESGKFDLIFEPTEPAKIFKTCIDTLQLQAKEKGLQVELALPTRPLEVDADQRALRQILFNLMSNAIKFSPEDGKIQLELKRIGRKYQLLVKDHGSGIPTHLLPQLGRPFTRADNSYNRKHEGTGLGLSVVHGLVALHQGEISIESRENAGTTVKVTLPVSIDVAAPQSEDEIGRVVALHKREPQQLETSKREHRTASRS